MDCFSRFENWRAWRGERPPPGISGQHPCPRYFPPHLLPGFTLIEIVVTLAILALLSAIALPAFNGIIRNNRLTAVANEFVSHLDYARTEAIKRGNRVTVCRSSNGVSCDGDWNDGWIVFDDPDGDILPAAGEQVLRYQQGALLPDGSRDVRINLRNCSGKGHLSYRADGRPMNNMSFGLCAVTPDGPCEEAREIIISREGRIRIRQPEPGADLCAS